MTIEQRALIAVPPAWSLHPGEGTDQNRHVRSFYIRGAEEQQSIDFEKACRAYCKVECPQNFTACWEDPYDFPCKGFLSFKKNMEDCQ